MTAIALLAVATAAHQGISAHLYSLASDMFPTCAVGSVIGIGGLFGAVSGALLSASTGYILGFDWRLFSRFSLR